MRTELLSRWLCRLGWHDWEFLFYGDRIGYEVGIGNHRCKRCGKVEERARFLS